MSESYSIQADWILPVAGPPIRDGALVVEQERISHAGPASSVPPSERYERLAAGLAILPGLVNAHTHLELTGLRGKMPEKVPMPQWILALLKQRADRADQLAAVREGVNECLATGTTTVGDISFNNASCHELAKLSIRSVAFAEVRGIGPGEHDAMARLNRSLANQPDGPWLRHGLSPHAPYSTSPSVYRQAIALARQMHWPIMTHLAETEGEREFLEKGGGAFLDLLRKLGIVNASLPKPGCGPVELAGELGLLEDDCILAHVNYIDDAELDILAAGRASVAYCPRSSRFFGRSGHRYAQMLRRGVNVAVGTDSLASNWSLDMLAELRAIYAQGQLDCQRILEMGTINAAKALGLSGCIGTLERGKQADFVVVEVGAAEDPLAALLEGEGGVERTVIAGQTVFRKSR